MRQRVVAVLLPAQRDRNSSSNSSSMQRRPPSCGRRKERSRSTPGC